MREVDKLVPALENLVERVEDLLEKPPETSSARWLRNAKIGLLLWTTGGLISGSAISCAGAVWRASEDVRAIPLIREELTRQGDAIEKQGDAIATQGTILQENQDILRRHLKDEHGVATNGGL